MSGVRELQVFSAGRRFLLRSSSLRLRDRGRVCGWLWVASCPAVAQGSAEVVVGSSASRRQTGDRKLGAVSSGSSSLVEVRSSKALSRGT
jgi:hypothetical protein